MDKMYLGDCILHSGKLDRDGYGLEKNGMRAHREAYRTATGTKLLAMRGLVVRHKCDNRACINPEHLILGTQAENIQDMISRGRKHYGQGETSPNHKLTEQDVREIRTSKLPCSELARLYKVGRGYIYDILNRTTWKHIS
jgi:hypothetical protein